MKNTVLTLAVMATMMFVTSCTSNSTTTEASATDSTTTVCDTCAHVSDSTAVDTAVSK